VLSFGSFLPSELQFAIIGACWVLLGIALMDQRWEAQPTAARYCHPER
jgi:hypothetical protein